MNLKKIGKLFTTKFVMTGPSSYKNRIYRAAVSQRLRNTIPDHIQRHTTVDRTPLDELSARSRDLYLTTHNIQNRQISMPPVEFEPTISAGERP